MSSHDCPDSRAASVVSFIHSLFDVLIDTAVTGRRGYASAHIETAPVSAPTSSAAVPTPDTSKVTSATASAWTKSTSVGLGPSAPARSQRKTVVLPPPSRLSTPTGCIAEQQSAQQQDSAIPAAPAPAQPSAAAAAQTTAPRSASLLTLRPSDPNRCHYGQTHVRARSVRIDLSRMSGKHGWNNRCVTDVNFDVYVLDAEQPRLDISRWRDLVTQCGEMRAREEWSHFVQWHYAFFIPTSLRCARTFARDHLEAVYVDKMASLFEADNPVSSIHDVPLFSTGDSVLSRWYSSFDVPQHLLDENEWRAYYGYMVPFDSFDIITKPADVRAVRCVYPICEEWYDEYWFPNGVPMPLPPIAYYLHHLFHSSDPTVRAKAFKLLKYEFALLFAAFWWQEAARGHRMFIVPSETVAWLTDLLGDIPIDPDTPFGPRGQTTFLYIAERMKESIRSPPSARNILRFPRHRLRKSEFVWSEHRTGRVNYNERSGLLFERRKRDICQVQGPGGGPPFRINRRRYRDDPRDANPRAHQHGRFTGHDQHNGHEGREPHDRQTEFARHELDAAHVHHDRQPEFARHERDAAPRPREGPHHHIHGQYDGHDGRDPRARRPEHVSDEQYGAPRRPASPSHPFFQHGRLDRLDPGQWGVHRHGPRNAEMRDFRPVRRRSLSPQPRGFDGDNRNLRHHSAGPAFPQGPPHAPSYRCGAGLQGGAPIADDRPAHQGPSDNTPLDPLRRELRDLERMVGEKEYDRPRPRRFTAGDRYPCGRLCGAPPGLFTYGKIAKRRGSRVAHRDYLLEQLEQRDAERQKGRASGQYVPPANCRPHNFDKYYDRSDRGGGGGGGTTA